MKIFTIFALFLHHYCAKTGAKTVKFSLFLHLAGAKAIVFAPKKVSFCTQNRLFLHSNALVFAPKTRKKTEKKPKKKGVFQLVKGRGIVPILDPAPNFWIGM